MEPPRAATPSPSAEPAAPLPGTTGGHPEAGALAFSAVIEDGHRFSFDIDGETGAITGIAAWPDGAVYALDGRLSLADADGIARFSMVDDAPERDPAAARGYYVGEMDRATGDFRGYYYETDDARYPFEGGYRR